MKLQPVIAKDSDSGCPSCGGRAYHPLLTGERYCADCTLLYEPALPIIQVETRWPFEIVNQRPSIDHSLFSPSGKTSTKAGATALKRERERLFPPGFWDKPTATRAELAQQKADGLRRAAKNLLDLADRGMNRHRFTMAAARMESEANALLASCKKTV